MDTQYFLKNALKLVNELDDCPVIVCEPVILPSDRTQVDDDVLDRFNQYEEYVDFIYSNLETCLEQFLESIPKSEIVEWADQQNEGDWRDYRDGLYLLAIDMLMDKVDIEELIQEN